MGRREVWFVYLEFCESYTLCDSHKRGEREIFSGSLEGSIGQLRELLNRNRGSEIHLDGVSDEALARLRAGLRNYDIKYTPIAKKSKKRRH